MYTWCAIAPSPAVHWSSGNVTSWAPFAGSGSLGSGLTISTCRIAQVVALSSKASAQRMPVEGLLLSSRKTKTMALPLAQPSWLIKGEDGRDVRRLELGAYVISGAMVHFTWAVVRVRFRDVLRRGREGRRIAANCPSMMTFTGFVPSLVSSRANSM